MCSISTYPSWAKPCYVPSNLHEVVEDLKQSSQNLGDVDKKDITLSFLKHLEKKKDLKNFSHLSHLEQNLIKSLLMHGKTQKNSCSQLVANLVANIYQSYKWKRGENTLPLHFWDSKSNDFYTAAFFSAQKKIRIIGFPIIHQFRGIFGWAAFIHKISGLSFLDSCPRMVQETKEKIFAILYKQEIPKTLIHYFEKYWDAILADILGFIYLGPGSKGLFSYLYFLRIEESAKNGSKQKELDLPDDLRFLFAKIIGQSLETLHVDKICLDNQSYPFELVEQTVKYIIKNLYIIPLQTLNNYKVSQIYIWKDLDLTAIAQIRLIFRLKNPKFDDYPIRHIISAAVLEACENTTDHQAIFIKMLSLLSMRTTRAFS